MSPIICEDGSKCPSGFWCSNNMCVNGKGCETYQQCSPNHDCVDRVCQPKDICGNSSSSIPKSNVYAHDCEISNLCDNVCVCKTGSNVAAEGFAYIDQQNQVYMDKIEYPSYTGIHIALAPDYPVYVCPGQWTKNVPDSHFGRSSFECK